MNALNEELKDRGFTLLLVDLWEKKDRVESTVEKRGYTARVVLDQDGKVSKAYRVNATPTVYLIDRDGTLIGQAIGPRPWVQPAGRALLEALLSSPPAASKDTQAR